MSPRKRLLRFLGNKTMLRILFQPGLAPRLKRRYLPTFATLRGGGYLLFCYIPRSCFQPGKKNFSSVESVSIASS